MNHRTFHNSNYPNKIKINLWLKRWNLILILAFLELFLNSILNELEHKLRKSYLKKLRELKNSKLFRKQEKPFKLSRNQLIFFKEIHRTRERSEYDQRFDREMLFDIWIDLEAIEREIFLEFLEFLQISLVLLEWKPINKKSFEKNVFMNHGSNAILYKKMIVFEKFF